MAKLELKKAKEHYIDVFKEELTHGFLGSDAPLGERLIISTQIKTYSVDGETTLKNINYDNDIKDKFLVVNDLSNYDKTLVFVIDKNEAAVLALGKIIGQYLEINAKIYIEPISPSPTKPLLINELEIGVDDDV